MDLMEMKRREEHTVRLSYAKYLSELSDKAMAKAKYKKGIKLAEAATLITALSYEKASNTQVADTHDCLAVWEVYITEPALMDTFPDYAEGAGAQREYIVEEVTPFLDKWWLYMSSFFGYDYAYDCDFIWSVIHALPHQVISELTLDEIGEALDNSYELSKRSLA